MDSAGATSQVTRRLRHGVQQGSMIAGSQPQQSTKRTILIMQGERFDGHLEYMYEPAVSTLREGFDHMPTPWQVEVAKPAKTLQEARDRASALARGDVMIWLGDDKKALLPSLQEIRVDGGVLFVYYQSEPVQECVFTADVVDELWDYSWHNLDACASNSNAPRLRYVPPGALRAKVTEHLPHPGSMLFFGNPAYRPCWSEVEKDMNGMLEAEYSVWDDSGFSQVLDKHSIFLNLAKGCEERPPAAFFRIAKLLNANALIISQRLYYSDEQQLDGMVDFVEIANIPNKYLELAASNGTYRQQLAKARADRFRDKFQPAKIFERAGIYDDF